MTEINEELALWRESLRKTASFEAGEIVLGEILANLGYFSKIFETGPEIYRNAALADAARWLENEMDAADPEIVPKIKRARKEMLERRAESARRSETHERDGY